MKCPFCNFEVFYLNNRYYHCPKCKRLLFCCVGCSKLIPKTPPKGLCDDCKPRISDAEDLQTTGEIIGRKHWENFLRDEKGREYISGFTHGYKHGYLDARNKIIEGRKKEILEAILERSNDNSP